MQRFGNHVECVVGLAMTSGMIKPERMAIQDSSPLQKLASKRVNRWLLVTLIIALIAVLGFLIFAPKFLDQNKLRARFLAEIGQWTGGQLDASRDLKLALFPEFKATLSDVYSVTSNAPIQLKANTIEIRLSLWRAMLGRIEGSSVQLTEADISFQRTSVDALRALKTNSQLRGSVALAAKQVSADMNYPDLSPIPNNRLGIITIVNSSLTSVAIDGTKEQFSNVNGQMNWPSLRGSATLGASATWRNELVSIDAAIEDPLIFIAGGNSPLKLDLASKPMTLSFQGKSNLVANFFADGHVAWKTPSMDRFLQWVRVDPLASGPIGAIELDSKLTTKDGKLLFSDLALDLSGFVASGTLEIDPVAKPIKSSGTLAFKSVDLAALAAALPIGTQSQPTNELRLLDDLDIDLRLSADKATILGYTIASVAGAIRIAKGDASIDLGTGEIAGGTVMGRLELSGPSRAKKGRLTASMSNVQQDQLSDLPAGIPVISGPVTGKLEISGPYANLRSLFATGDGSISLALDAGVIRNFNLETMQAAMDNQIVFELPTVYAGMSEAKSFVVKSEVKNGVAIIHSANATIDGRQVTLTGALALKSPDIALSGIITDVLPTTATKPLSFFIGGTWGKPLVTNATPN
jgi:AsmA protein